MCTANVSSARQQRRGWSHSPSSTLATVLLCVAVLVAAVEPIGSASVGQTGCGRSRRERSSFGRPADYIRRLGLPYDRKPRWNIAHDDRLQDDEDAAAASGAMQPWGPSDADKYAAPDSQVTAEKRQPYQVPDLCRHVCDLCHKKMSLTVSSLCPDQCVVGSGRHYEVCHAMWQLKLL